MEKVIKIGTRKSPLALYQARLAAALIERHNPGVRAQLIPMTTTGDRMLDGPLATAGGKGLFVKELDRALLSGQIDVAVHSLKDVPARTTPGIVTAAYMKREDPADVLVLFRTMQEQADCPAEGKDGPVLRRIGTSSVRRSEQLAALYPDAQIVCVRGNVQTRLAKLDAGEVDALVLAAAGLKRLGLEERISLRFLPAQMVPAAGQGILAVQIAQGGPMEAVAPLDDPASRYAALAERSFSEALDGGCQSPVGAYARWEEDRFLLDGFYEGERGQAGLTLDLSRMTPNDCIWLGKELARRMKQKKERKKEGRGIVWLAGAGPGDAHLLTLRTKELLEEADLIAYDALVSPEILSLAGTGVRFVSVGKRAGAHSYTQAEINSLLVREAKKGQKILRLKGGDPFLFGRGAEELESLKEAKIPYEIIPGVPSPLASLAYSGIPATHRELTSSVHLIAGHEGAGRKSRLSYPALVQMEGTLVFLMGLGRIKRIADGLLDAGMPPEKPCAVISWGTTARHCTVRGKLADIADEVHRKNVPAPAIFCVGDVCDLASVFGWRGCKPLAGRLYITTRPRKSGSILAKKLRALGAQVVELPSIRTETIQKKEAVEQAFWDIQNRSGHGWIVFTSPAGVESFFEVLSGSNLDIRSFWQNEHPLSFAVIGAATAKALAGYGIRADLMPQEYTTRSLGALLAEQADGADRIWLMRARKGAKELADDLRKAGIQVDDVALYDTISEDAPAWMDQVRLLLEEGRVDGITFTSASTVESFVSMLGETFLAAHRMACRGFFIGEKTAACARGYGIQGRTARMATMDSLVECIREEASQWFDIS